MSELQNPEEIPGVFSRWRSGIERCPWDELGAASSTGAAMLGTSLAEGAMRNGLRSKESGPFLSLAQLLREIQIRKVELEPWKLT